MTYSLDMRATVRVSGLASELNTGIVLSTGDGSLEGQEDHEETLICQRPGCCHKNPGAIGSSSHFECGESERVHGQITFEFQKDRTLSKLKVRTGNREVT